MKHWTKSNRLLGNKMILDSLDYNWSVYMLIHFKRFSLNVNLVLKVVHFNFSLDETPWLVWASSLPWTFIFHKEEVEIPKGRALSVMLGYSELWNGIWGLLACRAGNPRSMVASAQVPFVSSSQTDAILMVISQGASVPWRSDWTGDSQFRNLFSYNTRLYSLYIMPANYLHFHLYILPCPFGSFPFSFPQPICPH